VERAEVIEGDNGDDGGRHDGCFLCTQAPIIRGRHRKSKGHASRMARPSQGECLAILGYQDAVLHVVLAKEIVQLAA